MNSKSNNLIKKRKKNYLEKRKVNGKTETLYIRLLRNTKQCQWLLRQLWFQCHNCYSQTQHGASWSPAILEGKPGPTEGAQRMPLLESRKLFASNVLLFWRLSAQPVEYGILCIPSPSLQKRRERAMLNIQYSPRVQSLLVVFMDTIDLLWLLVPVRHTVLINN